MQIAFPPNHPAFWNYLRWTGWAAIVFAPFLAHVTLATGRLPGVTALVAAIQSAMFVSLVRPSSNGLWKFLPGLAGIAMGGVCRYAIVNSLTIEALVAHSLLYTALLVVFLRSLRPGRVDIATGLALRLGGARPAAVLAYTRRVTKAWCLFFAAQLATSATLLALAPVGIWSLFVNVLDLPSVGLMFLAEYAYRLCRFRTVEHVPLATIIRAFANRDAFLARNPAGPE